MAIDHQLQRHGNMRVMERPGSTRLKMMLAHGPHGEARLPTGTIALLLTLSGQLELESAETRWGLPRRSALLWRDGPLRITAPAPCRWLMLHGDADAWKPHVRTRTGQPQLTLLPWEAACPATIAHAMLRTARTMIPGPSPRPAEMARDAIAGLCTALDEQQAWLLQPLQRCSGRTPQHRQRTLLRLLRVRDMIRRSGDNRLDLNRLAAIASYSPCHLLRIYRDAFGETPSEYATSLRHRRAWILVHDTRIPVCEITGMLGFESQSSFCRAFKSAFGITTSEARRRHAERMAEGRPTRTRLPRHAPRTHGDKAAPSLSDYRASPSAARTGSR